MRILFLFGFLLNIAELSILIRFFNNSHNNGWEICSFITAPRYPIFGELPKLCSIEMFSLIVKSIRIHFFIHFLINTENGFMQT
jgi:hypothetical protein